MYLRIFSLLLGVACTAWSPASVAQTTGLDLVRANNCLACHQVDRKRVGPAFKLIAERFSGVEEANDFVAHAIRHGSRGRWGAIPMPAQLQVNERDAQDIAAWILSLADKKPAQP